MEIYIMDIMVIMGVAYLLFAITQGLGERFGIFPIIQLNDSNVKEQFKKIYTGEPVLFFVMQIIAIWIASHLIYLGIRGYTLMW